MVDKTPEPVQYIKDVIEVEDIAKVWDYLGKTFKFNVKAWRAEFEQICIQLPRNTTIEEAFMIYGKKKIEPLLNEILKRERHPTWIGLLTFILKDKIDKRKKRDQFYRGRYSQGNKKSSV